MMMIAIIASIIYTFISRWVCLTFFKPSILYAHSNMSWMILIGFIKCPCYWDAPSRHDDLAVSQWVQSNLEGLVTNWPLILGHVAITQKCQDMPGRFLKMTPSLKLTACPWKLMVVRWYFQDFPPSYVIFPEGRFLKMALKVYIQV